MMRDIDAPPAYQQGNEAEFRREVNRSLGRCYTSEADLYIPMELRLCLQSPDGTWHRIKVDNAGALSTEVINP